MKFSRIKVPGALLALIVAFLGSATAFADSYDPLRIPLGVNQDLMQYVVENGIAERSSYVAIMPGAVTSANESRVWKWCNGLTDPVCDPKNSPQNMKANSMLSPCTSAAQDSCIDSVEIGSGSNFSKANLIRVTSGLSFPASPEYNYPGVSCVSLWDAPGIPSTSGLTTYAVSSRFSLFFNNNKFSVGEFFTGVAPYKEVTGNYTPLQINPDPNASPENRYIGNSHGEACVFEEQGKCGVEQDFAPNTRVRLKIRIPKEIGGWFFGRINDPKMNVENYSATANLLTVDATSVSVPRMAFAGSVAGLNEQEKIWFLNHGYWPTADLLGRGTGPQAGVPEDAFPYIDYYRQKLKDTATGVSTFWNFTTTSNGSGSSCLADKSKILGIVSTNSMAYDGSSPAFQNGTLDYRVSGLHFMPDGQTPVQGSYNLVMRSETARCLYGFTNAPIKATISVSGSGSPIVATTVTGESNGWLSLAASGFTFSDKTIQVKLTQDAPAPVVTSTPVATPEPTPSASPTPVATATPTPQPVISTPKKITITCIKGKTTKTVTAVKPTCPTGYKKK